MRHLLSTIAERGGMAQDDLARWAGRADAKQNRVYNQMSEFEMVVRAEQFDPSKSLFGPVGEAKKHIRGWEFLFSFGLCFLTCIYAIVYSLYWIFP